MDLRLITARCKDGHWFDAEDFETRRLVEIDRGFIAFSRRECDQEDACPVFGMVEGGAEKCPSCLHSSARRCNVHADDERLVFRLGLGGELQRDCSNQLVCFECSKGRTHARWVRDSLDPE